MGRRRKAEQSILDDLFDLLLLTPFWVGPVLAVVVFISIRLAVPMLIGSPTQSDVTSRTLSRVFTPLATMLAPGASTLVIFFWLVAESKKWFSRRRLDNQTGIESIRQLEWRQFELLLTEAFRRQGYVVEHVGKDGPDGGVDIRIFSEGKTTLVQCKHWQKYQVGVSIVRELLGVVTSEGADGGIVVTSGSFTKEAKLFAETVPLQLINGNQLEQMIRSVQSSPKLPVQTSSGIPIRNLTNLPNHASGSEIPPHFPLCPVCGSDMQIRTAKRGTNAGSQFLGCTRFPNCRGTRQRT